MHIKIREIQKPATQLPRSVADSLVSTSWLKSQLHNPHVRIIEVNADPAAFWAGHIPGSIAWSAATQLSHPLSRDILSAGQIELLLSQSGVEPGTTIILAGDDANRRAAWAFWQLKLYGHQDVRILEGGRNLWLAEGHPLDLNETTHPETVYLASQYNPTLRALLPEVQQASTARSAILLDVRSPSEYTGELEFAERSGHIPGAINLHWTRTIKPSGILHDKSHLLELFRGIGIDGSQPVIVYCGTGDRSAHTWFVLNQILGFENVKIYDGAWAEWGNRIGAPIVRGPFPDPEHTA